MKKRIINKKLKNIFLSLMIAILIFQLISINVSAVDGIKVLKAETLTPLSLDGKKPKDAETVEYVKRIKPRAFLKKLGVTSVEPLPNYYENRTHINSGNQGSLDICWTFGNKNLLESYLSIQNNIKMEISARHMDYVLSDVMSGSINRTPGSEAAPLFTFPYLSSNKGPVKEVNFPYNTAIENPNVEELERNIENIYLEGYKVFPSIYKEINGEEITYNLMINGKIITDVDEEDILEIRDNMKYHIREYGAITAATVSSSAEVEYPSEEFVYNVSDDEIDINHNITIIGWDDNFCTNNPEGSLSGVQPVNSGAWLVSDSNQPKGNQFYYIAYDDVFIENVLIGFNDISIGSRFNTYEHDLIGANNIAGYSYENGQELENLFFASVYEKTGTDAEFLNKVGFMTVGNVEADVFYGPINDVPKVNFINTAIKIGSIREDNDGMFYHTIDIERPIELSEGKFAIYLKIVSNPGLGKTEGIIYTPVEAEVTDPMYNNIVIKNKSYIIGEEVSLSKYNFPIRAYTSNQIIEDEEDTFLVSYDLNGGTGEFPSVNIESGNYIENSQVPTKEGYKFIGWTPDPKTTPISANTTFIANWELKATTDPDPEKEDATVKPSNTVTFVYGDGNIKYIEIGADGYVKSVPIPETKEGYKFIGWNPDPKNTKVNEDTAFYGLWERIGDNNIDDTGSTTTDYTKGTTNDGTQANIRIPDAGKSITIIFLMIITATAGIVFYIKYRKIYI